MKGRGEGDMSKLLMLILTMMTIMTMMTAVSPVVRYVPTTTSSKLDQGVDFRDWHAGHTPSSVA